MRRLVWAATAVMTATLVGGSPREAAAEQPPDGAIPFPVEKTGTVRSDAGKTYYIDGAKVIPRTAEVTVQLGVSIVGINKASLDVQGGLKVHGTQDVWVTIRNVDFSPTRSTLKGIHLDCADLHGCKFVHGDDADIKGDVTMENSCLQRDCKFDVRLAGGFFKVMTVEFGMPCRMRVVRQKENSVPVEVEVRSSWMKAIDFTGPAAVNFMHSEIRGLTLEGVTEVLVDGCDLTGALTFKQGAEDTFKKVAITKVNFYDGCKLVLERPKGVETPDEKVKIDKPFFGTKESGLGSEDLKAIAKHITDGTDVANGTVKAWVVNPNKRPHALVSYDLRSRAPPLK